MSSLWHLHARACAAALLCVLGACAQTGQAGAELALRVAGSDVTQPVETDDGVAVQIDVADLAFGPLYLCAGAQAGDLCDTARLEWLDSVVVDTLEPEPIEAGTLVGVTGPVRSFMYDLGLSSQLTRTQESFVLDAARELGGVSLVLEGRAALADQPIRFTARVPVEQGEMGELGTPVVRKSASEVFFHEVATSDRRLTVTFDPEPFVRGIDFAALLADACDEQEPDAAEPCTDELTIEPGTRAFRSIVTALQTASRPEFDWN